MTDGDRLSEDTPVGRTCGDRTAAVDGDVVLGTIILL
jgi:hypothetical protein